MAQSSKDKKSQQSQTTQTAQPAQSTQTNKSGSKLNQPAQPIAKDKKKTFIIGAICVVLLLNIMWTVLQSKFTPKLDEVKADMAKLEQRLAKLEHGGLPDVADLKEEFSALKSISTAFEERLTQSIKAEEEQLASLEAQVEAQKSRVEALKKLAPAE